MWKRILQSTQFGMPAGGSTSIFIDQRPGNAPSRARTRQLAAAILSNRAFGRLQDETQRTRTSGGGSTGSRDR